MDRTEEQKKAGTACTKEELQQDIRRFLQGFVSEEYAGRMQEIIGEDIAQDVMECSGFHDEGCYTDDDIRLAAGRVLLHRLGADAGG